MAHLKWQLQIPIGTTSMTGKYRDINFVAPKICHVCCKHIQLYFCSKIVLLLIIYACRSWVGRCVQSFQVNSVSVLQSNRTGPGTSVCMPILRMARINYFVVSLLLLSCYTNPVFSPSLCFCFPKHLLFSNRYSPHCFISCS